MGVLDFSRHSRVLPLLGLAAWIAACGFFLVRGRGLLPPRDQDQTPQVAVDYAGRGEALIHGLPGDPDLAMNLPMSTVWAALSFHHWGASLPGYKTAVLAGLLALLGGVCLVMAPSSAWPAAAATLFVSLCLNPDFLVYPQPEYAFLVLLVAGTMAWRAASPGPLRTLAFSLSVGVTLLFRSPLAFFPPLFALAEWLWDGRRGRSSAGGGLRPYWKHAVILCVVPYLFLVPWMRMNWALRHRLTVLEGGQASTNVVAGALGLTQTIEGDWTKLVDPSVDASDPSAVLAWAAAETGRHPSRYLEAFGRRVHLCLKQFSLLWFLALVAWWRLRTRPAERQVGLLAAYFMLVHCSMGVDLRYLTPLWPLLAVLAGRLVRASGRPEGPAAPGGWWTAAPGPVVVMIGLAGCLALCAYTASKVWAMAGARPWTPADWDRAVSSAPEDAWLLDERAGRSLEAGDAAAAAGDLERASALRPDRQDYALRLAWARSLVGRGSMLDFALPPTVVDYRIKMAHKLYRARSFLAGKDHGAAMRELRAAKGIFEATVWVHGTPGDRERLLQEMLVARDERFGETAMGFMAGLPPKEAVKFCGALAEAAPSAARTCVGLIERAGDLDPAFAAEAVKRADSADLPPAERHRLALLRQRLGDYKGAAAMLRKLVESEPKRGVYFSDLGVNEFLAGSPDRALAALKRAIELEPDRLAPYASLAVIHLRQGRKAEALQVYDAALSLPGKVRDPRVRDEIVEARASLAAQP